MYREGFCPVFAALSPIDVGGRLDKPFVRPQPLDDLRALFIAQTDYRHD